MITPVLGLFSLCVFTLLMAELRGQLTAQYVLKPLAAMGFIALCVLTGPFESLYGQLILTALTASLIGDICLLKLGRGKMFLAGMAAFAVAHILYIAALAQWGFRLWWLWGLIPSLIIGLLVFRAIRVNVPENLRLSTPFYCIIIALMGSFAALATWQSSHGIFAIAAACFIVSDIFVSRHRFTPLADQNFLTGPRNHLLITPLYFFAQALFALSVGLT